MKISKNEEGFAHLKKSSRFFSRRFVVGRLFGQSSHKAANSLKQNESNKTVWNNCQPDFRVLKLLWRCNYDIFRLSACSLWVSWSCPCVFVCMCVCLWVSWSCPCACVCVCVCMCMCVCAHVSAYVWMCYISVLVSICFASGLPVRECVDGVSASICV